METGILRRVDREGRASETSLEGWKPNDKCNVQTVGAPFRNFLRGMETPQLVVIDYFTCLFRNFLRGMETVVPRYGIGRGRPSETSLEGWKPSGFAFGRPLGFPSETSLEGWKPPHFAVKWS